jgi:hypothetical protein
MIPVSDLCIGNWVYDGDCTQFPMWVQTIGDDYVYLNFEGSAADPWETTPEELQGIPLKGEVLKKIGFKYYSDNRYELCDDGWSIVAHPIVGLFRIEKIDPYNNIRATFTSEMIRHLHELQNAFFATTKQQLNIKL